MIWSSFLLGVLVGAGVPFAGGVALCWVLELRAQRRATRGPALRLEGPRGRSQLVLIQSSPRERQ